MLGHKQAIESGIPALQEVMLGEQDIRHHGCFIEVDRERYYKRNFPERLNEHIPVTGSTYGVGSAEQHSLQPVGEVVLLGIQHGSRQEVRQRMGVRVKFETPHVVGWEFKWYADGFLNRRDYAVLVGLQDVRAGSRTPVSGNAAGHLHIPHQQVDNLSCQVEVGAVLMGYRPPT